MTGSVYQVVVIALLLVVPGILSLWAIIDVIRFKGLQALSKVLWIVGILLFPYAGSLVWLLLGRKVSSPTFHTRR